VAAGDHQHASLYQPLDADLTQVANLACADGQVAKRNAGVWECGADEVGSGGGGGPHAATHQHGGSDPVAVAAAAPNAIPKADASGKLAPEWIPAHKASHQHGGADEIASSAAAGNAIPKAESSGRLAEGFMTARRFLMPPAFRSSGAAPLSGPNKIKIYGVVVNYPTTITRLMPHFSPSDGANSYDWGLYTLGGTRLASVGPRPIPTGSMDVAIAQGAVTIPAGLYLWAFTGTATTAQMATAGSSTTMMNFCYNVEVPETSSGGTLPATITVPASCDGNTWSAATGAVFIMAR
jgi:hypothetical protein